MSGTQIALENNMTSRDQSREDSQDLNELLYQFDALKPWQYFNKSRFPVASSVEKGKRTLNTAKKLKKVYMAKQRKITTRKNAAFQDVDQLVLTCCESGCLLRRGVFEIKHLIRQQRNILRQKTYNEQNYLFSKLMEFRVTFAGIRMVNYHIPTMGKVCKTAFMKCYGMSHSKIQVILNKVDFEGPTIEPDQRGKRAPRQFLPLVENRVIDFISSYEACESHYRRSRTNCKKYFESNVSMRQMWSQFLVQNPNLKTTSLRRKNKGPVISFSSFRNIFNSKLKDRLSFRKPRQDTCQRCDQITCKMTKIRSQGRSHDSLHMENNEIAELTTERDSHLKESEIRFASLRYDVTILASKV